MSHLLHGQHYHIYNHANIDDNLFREEANYRFFLQQYHQHIYTIWPCSSYQHIHAHFEKLSFFQEIFENKNSFIKQHTLKNERFIEYNELVELLTR